MSVARGMTKSVQGPPYSECKKVLKSVQFNVYVRIHSRQSMHGNYLSESIVRNHFMAMMGRQAASSLHLITQSKMEEIQAF